MDIPLEQLVYGSFPFWDRGYDVLAKSAGCRPDWVADVLAACRRFGEAPAGVVPCPCLFAARMASGPWAVVGVEPQGADDRGRPGALAFHALLIEDRDYRRAGADPFAFAGAHRRDWSAEASLESRSWTVEGHPRPTTGGGEPRALAIAGALKRGRRVALESAGPIEGLAREVWLALPASRRRRTSVATWAFGNGNRFDLVAVPRLAGVELDGCYLGAHEIEGETGSRRVPARRALAVAGLLVGVAVAAGLAWGLGGRPRDLGPAPIAGAVVEDPGPPLDVPERSRVVDGLEALADRFEAFEIGRWGDPSELMARISDRLRYRGPLLSADDRARLAAESDPDRDRALAWHERIHAFVDDRPLPEDFARLPLRRQLAEFARSYHLDPPSRADAIPSAVAEALSRDVPVRPTPLASRYPALSDYARFLGRLPRRGAGE